MKIFISVFGGLGNQMFQYAYMLSWRALGQRAEICPISFRMKDHNGFGPVRKDVGFSWSRFVFAVYRGFKKVFPKRLHDKVDNVLGVKTIVQSDHARYEDKCNDVTQGKRIVFCRGVWQSEKYFVSAVSEVRDAFKFDEEQLSDNSRSVLKKIRETNAVSIHVRRGDYLSFGNWSEMCPSIITKGRLPLSQKGLRIPISLFSRMTRTMSNSISIWKTVRWLTLIRGKTVGKTCV